MFLFYFLKISYIALIFFYKLIWYKLLTFCELWKSQKFQSEEWIILDIDNAVKE